MRGNSRSGTILVGAVAAVTLWAMAAPPSGAVAGTKRVVDRVSANGEGIPATGGHSFGALGFSADGRFVVFRSDATNLVPNDTNNTTDVFVRDRSTGGSERVNVASDGAQANAYSDYGHISADGRFVVFRSSATNLVSGDTNGVDDVFVRDRQTGTTSRVSLSSAGDPANGASLAPKISADGRFVVFQSAATNLVSGDTNGRVDIFLRDRQTATTERISIRSTGEQAAGGDSIDPWVSGDGRAIVFTSTADNLVVGDTNGVADVFLRDRGLGTTDRVSISLFAQQATGPSGTAQITPDGRFVIFQSAAPNLVSGDSNNASDIFLRDRFSGAFERVSVNSDGVAGNGQSFNAAVSADGNVVAFMSEATNLVPSIPFVTNAIYRRDRRTGKTERVSASSTTEAPNNLNNFCALSDDGRFVAFASFATNLVPFDTNGVSDIFVVAIVAVPATRQALHNPATSQWAVLGDDNAASTVAFGAAGDVPVPADYLGTGRAQVAVYRPSTGQWFIRSEAGTVLGPIDFGVGAIPVPGDYLGTGRAQLAVFSPNQGAWVVRMAPEGLGLANNVGQVAFTIIGQAGDIPVPGDYMGLGKLQQTVFRPSTREWFIQDPRVSTPFRIIFGDLGDIPVPGDYLGLGRPSVAVYRPSTGEWLVRQDNGQTTRFQPTIAVAGAIPVPGDYQGQGRDQLGLYLPSTGQWVITVSSIANALIPFGSAGAQPVPAPFGPKF